MTKEQQLCFKWRKTINYKTIFVSKFERAKEEKKEEQNLSTIFKENMYIIYNMERKQFFYGNEVVGLPSHAFMIWSVGSLLTC